MTNVSNKLRHLAENCFLSLKRWRYCHPLCQDLGCLYRRSSCSLCRYLGCYTCLTRVDAISSVYLEEPTKGKRKELKRVLQMGAAHEKTIISKNSPKAEIRTMSRYTAF